MNDSFIKAVKGLIESVEFDVNGLHGKGGHGGLTSDKTLRMSSDLRVMIDRIENGTERPPPGTAICTPEIVHGLCHAIFAAESYVLDGLVQARQALHSADLHDAPRRQTEMEMARDVYASCTSARLAAIVPITGTSPTITSGGDHAER